MAVSIEDVHMGMGEATLELDWDPEVAAELVYGRVLQIWWGEKLVWAGPLTRKPRRTRDGMSIASRSHEFWLGLDDDGPIIDDHEFVSGTNKLSNPSFSAELGLLYWRAKENSAWLLDADQVFTDVVAVFDDDALQSDESYEADPGMVFVAGVDVERAYGATGRVRLRIVPEGVFDPPNIFPGLTVVDTTTWSMDWSDWTTPDTLSSETNLTSDVAAIGPTEQRQIVSNPGFETGDFTDWTDNNEDADGDPTASVQSVTKYAGTYAAKTYDVDGGTIKTAALDVLPGERYRVEAFTQIDLDPLITDPGGQIIALTVTNGDASTIVWDSGSTDRVVYCYGWHRIAHEIDVPNDVTDLRAVIEFTSATIGPQYWDDVTLTRLVGNRAHVVSPVFAVTPKRTYRGLLEVQTDTTTTSGSLKIVATYSAAGRADVIEDVGGIDGIDTPGTAVTSQVEFRLSPPSGYDECQIELQGRDVYGGGFHISPLGLWDDDTTTLVFDDKSSETTGGESLTVSATMPSGTERVHVELVAEHAANGWQATNVSLVRDATTSDTTDVIDYLRKNPNDGNELVSAGSIADLGTVPYDLRYRNLTCRAALKQFSRAVMQPPCEWRINKADNTIDWDLPENLFVDRDGQSGRSLFVLKPGDVEVLVSPELEESAEASVQTVKVIGADRVSVGRKHGQITASATNSAGDKVDYYGRSWDRTRLVGDPTVDHIGYAGQLARYEADRADAPQLVRLELSDYRAIGDFDNGDWIYVYEPEADFADDANEMSVDGQTVYPERVRVASISLQPGPGFRAEVRKSDGTLIPLDGVRWNDDTAVEIEVGTLTPEFVADPQGGAAGNQFLRFRASSPR